MIGRLLTRLAAISNQTWLRWAAVFGLVGLALVVWAILDPTPIPVIVSMSVGQGFGLLSFLLFGFVLVRDLRRPRRIDSEEKAP